MSVSLRCEDDGMDDDTEPEADGIIPANDNQGPDGGRSEGDREIRQQVDRVALMIARLIGRRIARERFEALRAANDNRPDDAQNAEDGAAGKRPKRSAP
jgi:hypothetical protein